MENLQRLFADGSAYAWPVAFIAGILSVATPCVLPMLPITLSVLGVAKAETKRKALTLSLSYVAGIVICFTSLGVFSALTGTLFGSFLGHPVTAVAIALIFAVLAGASFELYEINLPPWLSNRLARSGGSGHGGGFVMGLVAGFIAVPCVGPVLMGILAYVASRANVAAGAGLLAVYALGFGLPFVLVGVLSLKLPKRGPWMRAVKSFFGMALLVTAFWFLRAPFPVLRLYSNGWIGPALLLGGLAIGALYLHFDGTTMQRLRKSAGIVLATVGAVLIMNTALATNLTGWCQDRGDGACIASACSSRTLTVVDFGAPWCSACRELDQTFADPRVVARLQGVGLVKIEVDKAEQLAERYGVTGVPVVIFLDGQCREIGRSVGYVPPRAFLKKLDSL